MDAPLNAPPRLRHFPVVRLTVAAVFIDFLLALTINHAPISFTVWFGFVLAQVGLLSVWAVLGPQRIWRQWTASLLTLTGFVIALTVGATIGFGHGQGFRGLFALPLVFTVAQLPLWLLRLALGWRMVRSGVEETAGTRRARQFGVQDLLTLTAAVALMLGLARFSIPASSDLPGREITAMWNAVVSFGLALAIVNTFLVPPCVWAGLRLDDLSGAIAGVVGYGLLLFMLIATVVGVQSRGSTPGDMEGLLVLFLAVTLGATFGVLRLAHACGYVLVTTWPKARPTDGQAGAESGEPPAQDTADSPAP